MAQAKEKLSKEAKEFRTEFTKTVSTLIISAFSLIAALAWNSAITQTITRYLKPGSRTLSWFLYAIIVTIIAVIVTIYFGRLTAKYKKEEK